MKLQGVTVEPPEPKVLVIPRNGVDLVFKAQYVDSYDEFDKLVPRPVPMKIVKANGDESIDYEDRGYVKELDDWSKKRSAWMFIKSLEATEGLEYSLIDLGKPDTWLKFDQEFEAVGFAGPIIERIKMLCFEACGINQSLIDEATERFLVGLAQESTTKSFPSSES